MQNDKIKEYWEGEAGIYSEGIKAELQSETAENWKNLILEYAPEKEHLEVLDVGCGPGFFEITLGKEGHHVTGIDITENMIHEAKENVKAAGLSADLMTMDCHNLDFFRMRHLIWLSAEISHGRWTIHRRLTGSEAACTEKRWTPFGVGCLLVSASL